MPPFRYTIAGVIAVLIIAAGAVYCRLTYRALEEQARQSLRDAKAAGNLPREYQGQSIETADVEDFGMQISEGMMIRLSVADLLSQFAAILVPVVIVVCAASAALIGWVPRK